MLKIYWQHNEGASELVLALAGKKERYESTPTGFSQRSFCCGNFITGRTKCFCGETLTEGSVGKSYFDAYALLQDFSLEAFSGIILASLLQSHHEQFGEFWHAFHTSETPFELLDAKYKIGRTLFKLIDAFNDELEASVKIAL